VRHERRPRALATHAAAAVAAARRRRSLQQLCQLWRVAVVALRQHRRRQQRRHAVHRVAEEEVRKAPVRWHRGHRQPCGVVGTHAGQARDVGGVTPAARLHARAVRVLGVGAASLVLVLAPPHRELVCVLAARGRGTPPRLQLAAVHSLGQRFQRQLEGRASCSNIITSNDSNGGCRALL
jgi:hypothetical protein